MYIESLDIVSAPYLRNLFMYFSIHFILSIFFYFLTLHVFSFCINFPLLQLLILNKRAYIVSQNAFSNYKKKVLPALTMIKFCTNTKDLKTPVQQP